MLAATILGSGLAFLDSSAIGIAIPVMGRDLDASLSDLQWVVTGYLLTLGTLVLVGGALGDVYGDRRIFLTGTLWFAAASVLCGLAWNVEALIVFRILQGVGAAMLVPTSLALIQLAFVPHHRAAAIGVWSAFSGVSSLLGPVVGGWLVDAFSWRLLFFVNPLIAIPVVVVALRFVPPVRPSESKGPDVAGGLAATAGLGGLVFALIEGPVLGWDDPLVIGAIAVGLVGLAALGVVETKSTHPMVPPGIFRSRQFTGANLYTLTVYSMLYGSVFFVQIQLQNVLGYHALAAGLAALPVTVMLLVLSPQAGKMAERIGPRIPMIVGPLFAAVGALMLAGIEEGTDYWSFIFPAMLLVGVGIGIFVAPLTAAVLAAVDETRVGIASGINNSVARLGGLLAVTLLPLAAGLETVSGAAYSEGFSTVMTISAGLMLVGSLIAALTIRERLVREDRTV